MEPNYDRPHYPPPPMDDNYGRTEYTPPMDDIYGRTNYPPPPMEENYGGSYNRPPPRSDYYDAPPPPPTSGYPSVEHVSHESESGDRHHDRHRFQPHVPTAFHHQTSDPELMDKPSFRVYTKADTNYSLTIRDGKVVLASNDPSDPFQVGFFFFFFLNFVVNCEFVVMDGIFYSTGIKMRSSVLK